MSQLVTNQKTTLMKRFVFLLMIGCLLMINAPPAVSQEYNLYDTETQLTMEPTQDIVLDYTLDVIGDPIYEIQDPVQNLYSGQQVQEREALYWQDQSTSVMTTAIPIQLHGQTQEIQYVDCMGNPKPVETYIFKDYVFIGDMFIPKWFTWQ